MSEVNVSPPNTDGLSTPAEFVAALGALRRWSNLTYRQLAAKAAAGGDVLPSSTIASALSRTTLPRLELVAAFTRACGLHDEAVASWVAARQRIAAGATVPTAAEPGLAAPAPGPLAVPAAVPARHRRRLRVIAGTIAVLAVLVVLAVGAVLHRGDRGDPGRSGPAPVHADGWYLIRPLHIAGHGLCLGEGRERNHRTDRPLAVQRPCDAVVPDTYLKAVGVGIYEIQWHSPTEGTGCLTVDGAITGEGALLAPADCVGAAHQRFLLETVQAPVPGGNRIRPLHSGLCVGILGGPAEVNIGAEAEQTACTGAADQEFLVEPTTRANRTAPVG